jgi:cytochrome c oxidase subunit 7
VDEALTMSRYGYHVPRTQARDNFYKKLEEERAAKQGR